MLSLNARTNYGLLAVVDLAQNSSNKLVRAKDIADRKQIPPKYLGQILATLVRAGLVTGKRGANGGYKLAIPSTELTMDRVLFALGPIPSSSAISVITAAQQAAINTLSQTTLATAAMDFETEPSSYQI
tara:strand:+ start:391 stop:777 length:387 start_codon:yes stop_codon:yes gene_type:complete